MSTAALNCQKHPQEPSKKIAVRGSIVYIYLHKHGLAALVDILKEKLLRNNADLSETHLEIKFCARRGVHVCT